MDKVLSGFRKGLLLITIGKSSGKGFTGNSYGLNMHSNAELHRHDPLYRDDRRQSPETFISYTYDIPKPITFDPHQNAVDRGDNPSVAETHSKWSSSQAREP